MFDFPCQTSSLRRPGLLLRAALAGQGAYNRKHALRRLLQGEVPLPAQAVARLEELEAEVEAHRQEGDAGYSVTRHVALLIALLAERQLAAACMAA